MTIVIVANGEMKNMDYVRDTLKNADYIIACDGGLRHCDKASIIPDIIVGDMDSADSGLLKKYGHVSSERYASEKEQTDLEIALEHACKMNPEEIIIICALGGRFDHQLANIHVMIRPLDAGINTLLCDENHRITLTKNKYNLDAKYGKTVTLMPLTTSVKNIQTKGLKYPLKDEELIFGFSRGVSNEIVDVTASVSVGSGILIIIQVNDN